MMSVLAVTVIFASNQTIDLELPGDMLIRKLAPAIAEAIQHSQFLANRKGVRCILKHAATGAVIPYESTLASAGMVDGDRIKLLVKSYPEELRAIENLHTLHGPGFISAGGRYFPIRVRRLSIGRIDPARGALPAMVGIDLTELDHAEAFSVSRRHASVRKNGDQIHLIDLSSINGTFVNGARIHPNQRTTIWHADRIQFGEVVLHLLFDGQEEKNDGQGR